MKIPRYFQSAAGIFQMCLFLIAMYLIWLESASASEVRSNIISKPSLLDVLAGILNDRELIHKGPKAKSHEFLDKQPRKDPEKPVHDKMKNSRTRSDLLRQELAKETQDNCLAKLLCDAPPQKPQKPDLVQDFGHLIKEFFDVFDFATNDPTIGERGNGTKTENDEDNENSDDNEDADDASDTEGRSESPNFVNISASIADVGSDLEDIVTTSTSATITEITTGATMASVLEPKATATSSEIHKMTLEELIGDVTLTPEDFDRLKRSRSMKFPRDPKQSSYLNRKLREMRSASTEAEKLKIARMIASKMREPKQCKQFDNVASEILSTCPLTSEVVRYFNSNLKTQGAQIALIKNHPNPNITGTGTGTGLVLVNDIQDRPHAYFLDSNSPVIANTKIATDLKNPTVPERYPAVDLEYQIYENAFPQVQNIKKVSLTKPPESKDSDESEEDGETDDEDDDNEEEEDEEEEDQNEIDEIDERQRAGTKRKKNFLKKHQPDGEDSPPRENRPPGIIKVYGVPQPSFDNEFSQISSQIGSGPVIIFDQDDWDANEPHPGPPIQPPRPGPIKSASTNNNRRRSQAVTTLKPVVQYSSDEDPDSDEPEDDDSSQQSDDPSQTYMSHGYRRPPGPPPNEYYRPRMPPRPMPGPYRPVHRPMNFSPPSAVRGRLNFIPSPGAGLMRPGMYPSRNFRFFGKK